MIRNIEYKGFKLKAEIQKTKFTIFDSYKVKNEEDMRGILSIIYLYQFYPFKNRNRDSLVQEWKTHNLFYKLHFKRSHSKSVDFDDEESKLRLFVYKMLGRF